jgi:hypothetical protein
VGIQEGVRRFTEWYKQYYGRVTSKPVDRSASQPGGR